jgi:hypothetical protein
MVIPAECVGMYLSCSYAKPLMYEAIKLVLIFLTVAGTGKEFGI